MCRVGIGWDAHAFGGPGPLRLGGVSIPFEKRLAGHSDADVLAHAVCDALLGAAGLDDIGAQFPDTDPRYKDIDSMILLERVGRMVSERFCIVNVDSTIVAQAPRVGPYLLKMRENIARALVTGVENVSVKAASPEGLGAIGRAEGIAAQAVASLATIN
jgi:2-C-methyl-D-erythritol 2,4-cyclodiphosphate synthase